MSSLLIVDNKPKVNAALEYLFQGRGYKVITASDPHEAIELLKVNAVDQPIGVVICDYQLSGISGTEFLYQVAQEAPQTKRILLATKSDMDLVVDAFSRGSLFRFLVKPCSYDLLLESVEEAFFLFNSGAEESQTNEELKKSNAELRQLSSHLEARIEHAARELREVINYDRLTGLPSKELIQDRLEFAIHSAKRSNDSIIVIFIGLENFRLVNEGLGHQAGNDLLCAFAMRLEESIQEGDSAARVHGDQFCLILNNPKSQKLPDKIVAPILKLLQEPFEIDEQKIYLKANFGISVFPADGDHQQLLFNRAEAAMHEAKEDPKNQYRFYSEELNRKSNERFLLQSQIQLALQNSEFKIYYQPRVNIVNGRVIGFEALIRWHHPERGFLLPADFLYILEDTGLICPVGEWLLNEVCQMVVKWQREVPEPLHVAVNVSPVQLTNGNFQKIVQNAIELSGLDLQKTKLELEITENILVGDVDAVCIQLDSLREMGVRIAIDDFGTGYSSLSYLIKFPIHYLKIDRTFVVDIMKNKDAKTIVQAITSLAHSLRMQVVAEGIETSDQLEVMHGLDCEEFQGFWFSEPVCDQEMYHILKSENFGKLVIEKVLQAQKFAAKKASQLAVGNEELHSSA